MELDDLSPAQRGIAERLGTLVAPPSAEVRSRLLVALHTTRAADPVARPRFHYRRRRLALFAAAALVMLGPGAGGTLALTAHALPGSPAYFIRLSGEHLRLRIAGRTDGDRLRVTFARERVEEARTAASGDRGVVEALLRDSAGYLGDAAVDLHDGRVDPATRAQLERQIGDVQTEERAIEGEFGIQGRGGSQGPAPQPSPGGAQGAGTGAGATATPSGAGAGGDATGDQRQGGSPETSGSPTDHQGTGDPSDGTTSNSAAG